MFYLYNACVWLLLPFVILLYLPFFLLENKHRRNFFERARGPKLVSVPRGRGRTIWVHAVSVGETLAAVPLVGKIREKLPGCRIFFSTITVTGMEVARKRVASLVEEIFYLPFDLYPLMRNVFESISPDVLVIMETEIWPNLIWAAKKKGVRVVVANGRFSDSSYPSYRRWRFFFRSVLREVDLFLMQSERDADRVIELGAFPERVEVAGNVKFDFTPPGPEPEDLIGLISDMRRGKRVLLGASTHEKEEEILLDMQEEMRENLFLVIAPRHPERFARVEELIKKRGIRYLKRSSLGAVERTEGFAVFLLDSMGELSGLYVSADIVFVGGTFVPVGGHNVLEPASFGKPVIVGPHVDNVRDIYETLSREGGLFMVETGEAFRDLLMRFVGDERFLVEAGRRAKDVVEKHRGVGEMIAERIESILE